MMTTEFDGHTAPLHGPPPPPHPLHIEWDAPGKPPTGQSEED